MSKANATLLGAVSRAERLEAHLAGAEPLTAACASILQLATESKCDAIAGASPIGDRLAGATVAMAHNGLRVFDPARHANRVLLLDGLLVSGTQLTRATDSILLAGANHVLAVVVLSVNEDPESAVPNAEHVVVLGGGN